MCEPVQLILIQTVRSQLSNLPAHIACPEYRPAALSEIDRWFWQPAKRFQIHPLRHHETLVEIKLARSPTLFKCPTSEAENFTPKPLSMLRIRRTCFRLSHPSTSLAAN